ncbi:MAG: hypothetical protein OEM65_08670, partial [Desulfuromonadales bacterium]|nr:hypothetical protein [Desulfuromonadales bacterium]
MSNNNSTDRERFPLFPTLDREGRIELVQHFEKSACWNIDFIIMMGLATALAALGLMQDSIPVVI